MEIHFKPYFKKKKVEDCVTDNYLIRQSMCKYFIEKITIIYFDKFHRSMTFSACFQVSI